MNKTLYFLSIAALALSACDKPDIASNTSKCIEQKIEAFEKASACKEGASVAEYFFQEKLVYVFNPGGCIADGSSQVMDADCNSLGYLGGFGGNTNVFGASFAKAEFKRTVWESK